MKMGEVSMDYIDREVRWMEQIKGELHAQTLKGRNPKTSGLRSRSFGFGGLLFGGLG